MPEPIESGCNTQPLSAGDLTPEHLGRRISAGTAKAAVLHGIGHSSHGYTTVWLVANGGGVLSLTLSDTAPVQLDAPQEVTGD